MEDRIVCEGSRCTGCMACVELCPKKAIAIQDTVKAYNAVIDVRKCVDCGLCYSICQNNQEVKTVPPIKTYQGWIQDTKLREKSSSGGAAMALSQNVIMQGGAVCSCVFENGEFRLEFVETIEGLQSFTGSKYVKSNPYGVYRELTARLKRGQQVLFIGLPCQVAAVKNVTKEVNHNLYTVDLICHGTPSPRLLDDFLSQKGINMQDIKNIQFRRKDMFGVSNDSIPMAEPGTCDLYSLAFLCSLIYTDNCYQCKYASLNRPSDLTIGDSWGSQLSQEELKKGVSLILCQTEKGKDLLDSTEMYLTEVDLERAVQNNAQLRAPADKSKLHDRFFKKYKKGRFCEAVFYAFPFKCVKQRIKAILIRMRIIRGWGI